MDPLEYFPIEVSELIMQHLRPSELLSATEVSTSWNEIIGKSINLMKKITIRVTREKCEKPRNIEEITMLSLRKYQSICFVCYNCGVSHGKKVCAILSASNRTWRKVHIDHVRFRQEDFMSFLKILQPTVEELKIGSVKVDHNIDTNVGDIHFPKLKILRIDAINLWSLSDVIQKCRSIVEFILDEDCFGYEHSMEVIKQIVENNQLQKWTIPASVFLKTFNSAPRIDFVGLKLKSFEIIGWTSSPNNEEYFQKFGEFLEMQSETLQYLAVGVTVPMNILQLMFKLPNLKVLKFDWTKPFHVTVELFDSTLSVNTSIRHFSFMDDSTSFEIMKALLRKTPNLTHLEVYSMDQKMMKYLHDNFPGLTTLKLTLAERKEEDSRKCMAPRKNMEERRLSQLDRSRNLKKLNALRAQRTQ